MRNNKLTIYINKSVAEVFEFTTNPENTHKWVDFIVKEVADGKQIDVGTTYTNWNQDGDMNSYIVSVYEKNKIFQLNSVSSDYKVQYTYTPISGTETELVYYEWNETEDLEKPFTHKILEKLKTVMES